MFSHLVMTSPKTKTAMKDWTTPRTAEETMCVIGEVILMLRKPAMQMRKPITPCVFIQRRISVRSCPLTTKSLPL